MNAKRKARMSLIMGSMNRLKVDYLEGVEQLLGSDVSDQDSKGWASDTGRTREDRVRLQIGTVRKNLKQLELSLLVLERLSIEPD